MINDFLVTKKPFKYVIIKFWESSRRQQRKEKLNDIL